MIGLVEIYEGESFESKPLVYIRVAACGAFSGPTRAIASLESPDEVNAAIDALRKACESAFPVK